MVRPIDDTSLDASQRHARKLKLQARGASTRLALLRRGRRGGAAGSTERLEQRLEVDLPDKSDLARGATRAAPGAGVRATSLANAVQVHSPPGGRIGLGGARARRRHARSRTVSDDCWA
jgi:hypothetical protein